MTQYEQFLAAKVRFQHEHGFDVDADAVHPMAMPHVFTAGEELNTPPLFNVLDAERVG